MRMLLKKENGGLHKRLDKPGFNLYITAKLT